MKLANSDFQENAKSKIVAQVFSDPFTVYSAKKFPGMTESTELSKIFAKQGLKIPIRNDVRARKTD
ncbi:Velvet complex subunit 2 [Rhizopus azygosporus]|nr:Velvet complex subunit 2 [Rhizopus azygosporus]